KDSYTFVLNQNGPYPLARGGEPIGSLASLEFELEGDPVDFGAQNIAYTLVENDISSGVFTVELDMDDIVNFGNDGNMLDVDDGDTLEVTYDDFMDDVARNSTDKLTIGKEVEPGEETCFDIAATIVGTEGHDVLNGTLGDDVIVGLRGNDVINGMGGDDVICGGLGLDELSGGPGNDRIFGGNGNDAISGNSGYDSLWGGQGWDRLFGGLGRDNLYGGVGNDLLEGGDGDDRLFGQSGTDRLDGGPGDNLLVQD
ncbi:MAG TPA: calcium-binding protein, partial [Nitrososphaera sp.]|nr:calcium-binding protein [Nitrososphaera sp.]